MTCLKIAIIGAGPAGCLLARLLKGANVEVTIFEAEQSLSIRSQGGTLDLHPKTGIAALKAAGLYNDTSKLTRLASACLKITDKKLKTYFYFPASMHAAPEIDRAELCDLLLASIPQNIVQWDHRLERIDHDRTLHFANGKSETGYDLVVGADGAWSQVRKVLSDQSPEYSGVAGHDLRIMDASARSAKCSKLIGGGSLFAFSDGKSIMGQQMGDSSINVLVWGRRDEDWFKARRDHPTTTPAELLEGYDDWNACLRDMVLQSDGEIRTTALYMLPVGFKWGHQAGITLIGDSAHLMTPFGGEGVNLALEDASKLAKAILIAAKHGNLVTALDRAVSDYEAAMFKRALRAQNMAFDMMNAMYFTEGAPRTSIESWLIARASYDTSPTMASLSRPFLVAGVYCAYFWCKLLIG